nr:sigma-70 family RNA polymerase sigma factor [Lederbergia citrea]
MIIEPVSHHQLPEEKLIWLMNEYGNDVIRIAFSYLKNKQLAEDIAQDVFLRCYENMDTFRNESSYKTWVIRITVNRCKDVLKSWSYKNLAITEFLTYKQVQPSFENELFGDEENEFLSRQILKLPVKQREVIILFYYQEFSLEEISHLLNININTIKTRLHRARNNLRTSLEGGMRHYGK